jgi:hypothetical protein
MVSLLEQVAALVDAAIPDFARQVQDPVAAAVLRGAIQPRELS